MNIANYEQRMALSAHRQRMRVTHAPLSRRAQLLRPYLSIAKLGGMIVIYFVLFGFFFQSSRAEFEANAVGLLSRPVAVATDKKTSANNSTQLVAESQTEIATEASPSPESTSDEAAAHAGLPPYNDESESAPSTKQQFTATGYAYGHCTFYVARRRPIPQNWGNARDWLTRAKAAGFLTGVDPHPGAIAQTTVGPYGHVAYVERVEGTKVYVSEYNYVGWNRLSYRWTNASDFKYIY